MPRMTAGESDAVGEAQHPLGGVADAFRKVRDGWLLAAVVVIATLYHWLQALERATPWIFPDELRYTEFARAAADGTATVAGETRRVGALQGFLLGPAWLIDDPGTAWAVAKLINVIAFCLTAVPVYLLARRYVSGRMAVLTALAAVLLPISFYASTMMQEPIALPIAMTTALVTVQLIERFSWVRVALLVVACGAGAGVRGQLTILPLAAAAAFLLDAAVSAVRRHPIDLRRIILGLAFTGFGVLTFREGYGLDLVQAGWEVAKQRPGDTLDTVIHSVGATIVGTAVIPAVAFVAALAFVGSDDRPRAAFAATAAGFGALFIAYTGLKSASLDFILVSLVEERNLIYLEPLAVVAVACIAANARWRGLAVASAAVIAFLIALPIAKVGSSLVLSENPGLSWVWHIHEKFDPDLELPLTIGVVALVLVGSLLIWRRFAFAALAATSTLALIAGAFGYRGDHRFSRALAADWLQPDRQWVDAATAGRPTALLVSGTIPDPNGIWSLVFWNRSIGPQVLVPGAPGLSIAGVPIAPGADGTFSAAVEYALHTGSVRPDGTTLPQPAGARYLVTRLSTPTRLGTAVEGLEPDRWVRERLSVQRFFDGPAGKVELDVSTQILPTGGPRTVTATVGDTTTTWTVPPSTTRRLRLPVPSGPFVATYTFSPVVSPGPFDPRLLSLQVNGVSFPGDPPR